MRRSGWRRVARLRVKPSWGLPYERGHTVSLYATAAGYCLDVITHGLVRTRSSKVLNTAEVERRLGALKRARVPAFPCSPMAMDASLVQLTIEGEYSTLTLGWTGPAPDGASGLARFADWLLGMVEDQDDD